MDEQSTAPAIFLFTDIERSTRLWEQHPEAMGVALRQHDAAVRSAIVAHGGHVFKTLGDGFCATFDRASAAVDAAIAAQRRLQALLPATPAGIADLPVRVRIALHSGAAEAREGDFFGPTLNRIARLVVAGHGGQVLVSQDACDLVWDQLPAGASLRDLGSHRLRDLLLPEQIYQLVHPDLPDDFPALRSMSALAHNLPLQTTRFVGREPEIGEIRARLATTRLLTLTGTGGTGKTRLALQLALELLGEYKDGVWLIELAALTDPALVPGTVAATLGVREEWGRPVMRTLLDQLGSRQFLLILDNCEHLLGACAELAQSFLQSCPAVRILATSRERLNTQGEYSYCVPSLSTPAAGGPPARLQGEERVTAIREFEAVELFLERAAQVSGTFVLTPQNACTVAEICRRLDGIPLAIELAAARLNLLSVEQILVRLDDMFHLLTGGHRTALPRQQTLRALVDWSYNLLSEAEATALRRLSVFAGGFTIEAAEAVCADEHLERDQVLDLLVQLLDKSLIGVAVPEGERRFRLLEPIRQYASEKLWEAGEGATARWAFRGWLLELVERALAELSGPERAAWLQRLADEHDNVRAAMGPPQRAHSARTAAGHPRDLSLCPARIERWGHVAEQLVPAYRQVDQGEAARGILEDFIGLCEREDNPVWLARGCTRMGNLIALSPGLAGNSNSRTMYERAIAVCEAHGLEAAAVHPRFQLAYGLARSGGDLARAEDLVRMSLPTAEAQQDGELLRTAYSTLMRVATHRADWMAFRTAFDASLAYGGPANTPFDLMLTQIEEHFHRQGADDQFVALCGDLAARYREAGLQEAFTAWHLSPTTARPTPGEPWLREEFEGECWHPALQPVDPTGRTSVDRHARPGWLRVQPAEDANLWPTQDLNAPRLLAPVSGEFVAQTRVELGEQTQVLAGLLLWRDEGNFVRLELQLRSLHGERPSVHLEARVDGQYQVWGRGQCDERLLWLRFEREGDVVRGLCSPDGESWRSCGYVNFPSAGTDLVGIAAVWHGPGAYAWFDNFLIWQQPPGS